MNSKTYPCPNCKASVKFDKSNPFRPFCSERCKLIDLGEWASESYKIPSQGQLNTNDYDFDEEQDERS
ncbi:MAG: DNA gyrase inhibitor YacG [Candidatus Berkiella sp.]